MLKTTNQTQEYSWQDSGASSRGLKSEFYILRRGKLYMTVTDCQESAVKRIVGLLNTQAENESLLKSIRQTVVRPGAELPSC